ncbi:MAG: replication initiation protein [Raineya sp.]|jgi:plasmid replication initiation protein|nr:replication initiation protein [Raineya sp.]
MKDTEAREIVSQHNVITNARYEMTACEMDIFFYLLSVLKKDDKSGTNYTIYMRDIEQITGKKWNYEQFRDATYQLLSRVYEVEDDKSLLQVSVLASAHYMKGQGYIELEISDKIRPYLINLKENFTTYRLKSALMMTSKYAKRIYQLVSQWKDVNIKQYTIDDLKHILKLKDPKDKEPELYKQIGEFKKYVLDVAVKQINESTELQIAYELFKKGRSVHSVQFYIHHKTRQTKLIAIDDDPRIQTARKILNDIGLKDERLIKEIVEKHLPALFKWNYDVTTGKIKVKSNAAGLLLRTLGIK